LPVVIGRAACRQGLAASPPPDSLWHQPLVSSRLLEYEVWNRIHAQRLGQSHGDAVRELIGRVAVLELAAPVLGRALEPFPIPVRTLDVSTSRFDRVFARTAAND
jgi:hypothetical protein